MNLNKLLLLFFLVTSLFSNDKYTTNFNYFGNLSAGKLNSSGYDLNDYNHDSTNDSIGFSAYSKVAAQFSLTYDDLTFTAQGLLREKHSSLTPEITWFNIKYDINDNYALRLGRIQTKVLLNSESLDIDYLHLWAKPPVEVYRLMPVRTFNGLELSYNETIDDKSFHISIVPFGFYKSDINSNKNRDVSLKIDNSHSVSLTLENETITYKASFSKSDTNIKDLDSTLMIVNGLKAYGNDMQRYTFEDRVTYSSSFGVQYAGELFLFDTELAHFKSNSLLPTSTAAYVMLGYKMDKLTPYMIYAENKNDKSHFNTSNIKTSDDRSVALKKALNDVLYLQNYSQQTTSIGVRYDIKVGLALKTQIDRITTTNYGDISSLSIDMTGYERVGILSRDAGTRDKVIYAWTVSLSFAY